LEIIADKIMEKFQRLVSARVTLSNRNQIGYCLGDERKLFSLISRGFRLSTLNQERKKHANDQTTIEKVFNFKLISLNVSET
jgi:hypothetical protein